MKTGIVLILFLCLTTILSAQDPSLKVTASAGNSYTSNSYTLDWTLGEVVIRTIENDNAMITQGMHQPTYTTTAIHQIPAELGTIQLYPNPVIDFAKIEVALTSSSELEIYMNDATGKFIWVKKYSGQHIEDTYTLTGLASGTYFITIRLIGKSTFQTFQIAKIN